MNLFFLFKATTRFELVIRVLQTRALPLGYVAIFHGPDETLYFSSKHDFNKAPRFRQGLFSFISFILNFIFLSIFYLFFYMLNLQLPCRSTLFFIFVFSIIYFFSCTGFQRFLIYTKGTEGNPSQALRDMLKNIEHSRQENIFNPDIASIHEMVADIKKRKEVGIYYMKSWEREKLFREMGKEEDSMMLL